LAKKCPVQPEFAAFLPMPEGEVAVAIIVPSNNLKMTYRRICSKVMGRSRSLDRKTLEVNTIHA
jgi:hypothetical protein